MSNKPKYIEKVNTGGNYRYFYTQEEYDAYLSNRNKVQNMKNTIGGIQAPTKATKQTLRTPTYAEVQEENRKEAGRRKVVVSEPNYSIETDRDKIAKNRRLIANKRKTANAKKEAEARSKAEAEKAESEFQKQTRNAIQEFLTKRARAEGRISLKEPNYSPERNLAKIKVNRLKAKGKGLLNKIKKLVFGFKDKTVKDLEPYTKTAKDFIEKTFHIKTKEPKPVVIPDVDYSKRQVGMIQEMRNNTRAKYHKATNERYLESKIAKKDTENWEKAKTTPDKDLSKTEKAMQKEMDEYVTNLNTEKQNKKKWNKSKRKWHKPKR